MTKEKFKQEMEYLRGLQGDDGGDIEIVHDLADKLLCKALREIGYSEGVEIFEQLDKWYA